MPAGRRGTPEASSTAAELDVLRREYETALRLIGAPPSASVDALIVEAWAAALADQPGIALDERFVAQVFTRVAERDRAAGRSLELPEEEPELERRFLGSRSRWGGFWRRSVSDGRHAGRGRDDQLRVIEDTLSDLPLFPRAVVVLRDLGGWSAQKVIALLGTDQDDQCMLLSRGRDHLAQALERVAHQGRAHA